MNFPTAFPAAPPAAEPIRMPRMLPARVPIPGKIAVPMAAPVDAPELAATYPPAPIPAAVVIFLVACLSVAVFPHLGQFIFLFSFRFCVLLSKPEGRLALLRPPGCLRITTWLHHFHTGRSPAAVFRHGIVAAGALSHA